MLSLLQLSQLKLIKKLHTYYSMGYVNAELTFLVIKNLNNLKKKAPYPKRPDTFLLFKKTYNKLEKESKLGDVDEDLQRKKE